MDGTPNKQGMITKYTWLDLTINGRTQHHNLFITGLGKQKIILGYPWFKQNNPEIDWEKCTLTWRKEQDNHKPTPKPLVGTHGWGGQSGHGGGRWMRHGVAGGHKCSRYLKKH